MITFLFWHTHTYITHTYICRYKDWYIQSLQSRGKRAEVLVKQNIIRISKKKTQSLANSKQISALESYKESNSEENFEIITWTSVRYTNLSKMGSNGEQSTIGKQNVKSRVG